MTPLYWGMSALAQAATGYRLVGEVALGITLVAFAFAVGERQDKHSGDSTDSAGAAADPFRSWIFGQQRFT